MPVPAGWAGQRRHRREPQSFPAVTDSTVRPALVVLVVVVRVTQRTAVMVVRAVWLAAALVVSAVASLRVALAEPSVVVVVVLP